MGIWQGFNARAKKLTFLDIELLQVTTVCFTVLVIKFAPRIIIIRKELFIALLIISAIKPLYDFWFKK